MIDLGKWLGEEYRVPERYPEEREDEASAVLDTKDPNGG
jgi:endogenous inhibitor of DNA gyrase (YacG/DUF329 family)